MKQRLARKRQPSLAVPKRRQRRSSLDAQVIEYLLRAGARLDRPQDANTIAQALKVPYSTATAALRRLDRSGRLVPRYVVNSFRTQYCHEYRVALAIDGRAIPASHEKRRERLAKLRGAGALRNGGLVELFIEEVIDGLANNRAYREHLIVDDVLILHGAQDRDLELCVLTDDGSFSLGCWIRNELTRNPCIRAIHTVTVGFRYSRNGYSGQYMNHEHAASRTAASDEH